MELIKCYCGHTTMCDCIPEQEKSYSEKEVYVLIHERDAFWKRYKSTDSQDYISTKDWFEQFKKK